LLKAGPLFLSVTSPQPIIPQKILFISRNGKFPIFILVLCKNGSYEIMKIAKFSKPEVTYYNFR
jgi:hypothetical protein